MNLLLKLSYLSLNFALTLGYLNPAWNNPALGYKPTQRLDTLPFSSSGRLIYINYPIAKIAALEKGFRKISDLMFR